MATDAQIERLLKRDAKAREKVERAAVAGPAASRVEASGESGGPLAFLRGTRRGAMQLAPQAAREMAELGLMRSLSPATSAVDSETGSNTIRGLRESRGRNADAFRDALGRGPGADSIDANAPIPRVGPEANDGSLAFAAGERLGESLPFASPGLGATMIAQAPRALAVEIAAEVAAVTAGAFADTSGGGGVAQAGAEMFAAMAVPGAVANRWTRRGARAVAGTEFGKRVAEVAQDMGERLGGSRGDMSQSVLKEYASKLGVEENMLKRVSSEAKRRFPEDPFEREEFIRQAVGKLREVEALFPDPRMRPSTRQSLGELEAQNISSMDEQFSSTDLKYSNQVAGRRLTIQQDLERQMADLVPEGTMGRVSDDYGEVLERAEDANRELWSRVNLAEMPMISTRSLKAAAKADARRVGFKKNVPAEIQEILDLPDEISVEQLQNIRSEMLLTGRIARKGGEKAQRSFANTTSIRKQLKGEIDGLSSKGSAEYRKALKSTREMHDLFAADSKAVEALSEFSDTQKVVGRIKNAKRPADEARRVIRILEQQSGESVDAFRRVTIDDLFGVGVDYTDTRPWQIRKRMKGKEDFYRAALGDDRFNSMIEILKKAEMSYRGKAGTVAATASTGTGRTPAALLFAGAEAISEPAAFGRTFGEVGRAIVRNARNNTERMMIMREAMLDPTLMRVLLEMPTERATERWVREFGVLVGRAKARQKLSIAQRSGMLDGRNNTDGANGAGG